MRSAGERRAPDVCLRSKARTPSEPHRPRHAGHRLRLRELPISLIHLEELRLVHRLVLRRGAMFSLGSPGGPRRRWEAASGTGQHLRAAHRVGAAEDCIRVCCGGEHGDSLGITDSEGSNAPCVSPPLQQMAEELLFHVFLFHGCANREDPHPCVPRYSTCTQYIACHKGLALPLARHAHVFLLAIAARTLNSSTNILITRP